MKNELISSYIKYLRSYSDQDILIPDGFEDRFWEWFGEKSRIFSSRELRANLKETDIPIEDNFCFKNTYRVAKGFTKRFYYYEGFSFAKQGNEFLRHAFNVCGKYKVNDYSLRNKPNKKYDYYVGVKIPLWFARKVYLEHGDYLNAQDSLLVPYFMFLSGMNNYLKYTSP
jgi:hypothetical protein